MKKFIKLLMIIGLLSLFVCSSCKDLVPLKVVASTPTIGTSSVPVVFDSVEKITLQFNKPLDESTIQGNIKLYCRKSTGELTPVDIIASKTSGNSLQVTLKNGAKLSEGEEYKLEVVRGLKATTGPTLKENYAGYFVINYSFNVETGISDLHERSLIVVISDTHMGDQRSLDQGYGWLRKNKAALEEFLTKLKNNPNVKELVIAGDMFDEWILPMDSDTFNGKSENGFFNSICDANKEIVKALNNIIMDKQIKVTYVPGNHDALVTKADIDSRFPGINQARDDVDGKNSGMGAYEPDGRPEIIIEHSHRYDMFNAPDPISNRDITKSDSILPPGFFVSKIAVSSDMENSRASTMLELTQPQAAGDKATLEREDEYYAALSAVYLQKPTKAPFTEKVIKTGIDGLVAKYSKSDLLGEMAGKRMLYKDIIQNWDKRQDLNKVPVKIAPEIALANGIYDPLMDAMADVEYFFKSGSNKRVVVFGHTHKAFTDPSTNLTLHKPAIYGNSGGWVDFPPEGYPGQSYIVISTPPSTKGVEMVSVYQYSKPGNKPVDCEAMFME